MAKTTPNWIQGEWPVNMQLENVLGVSGVETTNAETLTLRQSTLGDAAAIAQIFNEEVLNGYATYESVPHTTEQRLDWLKLLQSKGLAAILALHDNKIVGFAALTPFHPASGYRFTASAQIYLTHDCRGRGIGTTLVRALYDQAIDQGLHCVIAGVNSRNQPCQALLRRIGFKTVGHFRQIGFKNGQWWDDTCFQLILPTPKTQEKKQ